MQQHRNHVRECREAISSLQHRLDESLHLMRFTASQIIQGACRQYLAKKKLLIIKKSIIIQRAYRACDKTLFMQRKFERKIRKLEEALALQSKFVKINYNNAVYWHFFRYGWDNIRGNKIQCQLCSYQTAKECKNLTSGLKSIYQHLKSKHCIHTDLKSNFQIFQFKTRYGSTISKRKRLLKELVDSELMDINFV